MKMPGDYNGNIKSTIISAREIIQTNVPLYVSGTKEAHDNGISIHYHRLLIFPLRNQRL
jgi:hypothetical protein